MLIQHLSLLSGKHIVLASASPRRAQLLRGLGLQIEVIPSAFDENLDKSVFCNPGDYATATAKHKTIEVSRRVLEENACKRGDLIIGADTVVELDGAILEKPCSTRDAFNMLSSLSGRRHKVFTGVALLLPSTTTDPTIEQSPLLQTFWEETVVEFGKIDNEEIKAYIATGDPMDKAGAYGIQGLGGSLVKSVTGCFYNVVGFPIHRFAVELDKLIKCGALTVS